MRSGGARPGALLRTSEPSSRVRGVQLRHAGSVVLSGKHVDGGLDVRVDHQVAAVPRRHQVEVSRELRNLRH